MAVSSEPSGDSAFMFLNEHERRTIEAISERIFPTDEFGPGARDTDAVVYIDRALAGYGHHLQQLYRRGIKAVDRVSKSNFEGRAFADVSDEQQDSILRPFLDAATDSGEEDSESAESILLNEFLGAVRLHTMEGVFCDPIHGGNRNAENWKLIGFPGAQWGYSAEQMKLGFDATTIPIKTLADLRREYVSGKLEK